jgi:chromosome segregation ATPase
VTPEPRRQRGRPRKWQNDAERQRAYRARLAKQLAEPLQVRAELRAARSTIATMLARAASAERDVLRLEMALHAADRRVAGTEQKLARSRTELTKARAERNRAKRLLKRRLLWSAEFQELRTDPEALLAVIGELAEDLEWSRRRRTERSRYAFGTASSFRDWADDR